MGRDTPDSPEEEVLVEFSGREVQLLIEEAGAPVEVLADAVLRMGPPPPLSLPMTPGALRALAADLATAANHATDPERREELERFWRRLFDLAHGGTDEPSPPDERTARNQALLEQLFCDAQAFADMMGRPVAEEDMQRAIDAYNTRADPDLGGLSPTQAGALLYSDWGAGSGSVCLNEALTLADLGETIALHDSRLLLQAVLEAERIKSTPKGNLNRKFVAALAPRLRGLAQHLGDWWLAKPMIDELHVWALHRVRIVVEAAGLLRRARGYFSLTKRGRELLAEGKAGALYARLFRAHFRKLNLDYFSPYSPPCPAIQHTAAFSLYMLARCADDWRKPEDLAPEILLRSVRDTIPLTRFGDPTVRLVETHLLDPLLFLGLLEQRVLTPERVYPRVYEVRKTPLYDAFLSFDLPPSDAPEYGGLTLH